VGKNNIKIMKKIRCYEPFIGFHAANIGKNLICKVFPMFFSQKRQNKDYTTVIWPCGGHDCEVCLISKWVMLCRF
jgi:hypothetical protein